MALDPRIIVFRTRLRDGISQDYERDLEHIAGLAVAMPGFVAAKAFIADDGERLALIEFDTADHLAAWREHPEQLDAAIATCDAAPAALGEIAERWLACFARRDLEGLLALYADDATHTSPKIRARHPDTGGLLRGKPAMRVWWQDSFDRLPSMRYEPTAVTADHRRVFMEYIRHVDGDPDYPVAEVLEIEAGKIIASRVFHG